MAALLGVCSPEHSPEPQGGAEVPWQLRGIRSRSGEAPQWGGTVASWMHKTNQLRNRSLRWGGGSIIQAGRKNEKEPSGLALGLLSKMQRNETGLNRNSRAGGNRRKRMQSSRKSTGEAGGVWYQGKQWALYITHPVPLFPSALKPVGAMAVGTWVRDSSRSWC